MTQNTTTTLLCDNIWHGDDETAAEVTRTFTFDGIDYEIDLCAKHAEQFDDDLGPWLNDARRVVPPKRRHASRSSEARRRTAEIRDGWKRHPEWSERPWQEKGRLPGEVTVAFNAAA